MLGEKSEFGTISSTQAWTEDLMTFFVSKKSEEILKKQY